MKRILLISHNALSLHNNNGKTLAAIFDGWEASSFAQLYFNNEIPESKSFNNFFRLTDTDILKKAILGFMIKPIGSVVPVGNKLNMGVMSKNKVGLLTFIKSNDSIKLLLRDIIFASNLWFSLPLKQWLYAFKPEHIFFLGGNSVFSFLVMKKIAEKLSISYDVYITDDYILNVNNRGLLQNFNYQRLRRVYSEIFPDARYIFVIGDEMANAFTKEYGREFIPIMNTVNMPNILPKNDFSLGQSGQVDIVYSGGLHLGRDSALVEFSKLIKMVSLQLGIVIRLSIYSLQYPSSNILHKLNTNGAIFIGAINHEDLPSRLKKADIVLHVESFEAEYVAKTKLSISTKIPEYLASGTCLLAYGHSSLASMRMIDSNNIGLVLTEKDSESELKSKLISAVMEQDVRYNFAKRGFEYAKKNFDRYVVTDKIQKILNQ